MKKILMILVLLIAGTLSTFASYFVGVTTTSVNLRYTASTEYEPICVIKKGSYVFVDTDEYEDGFYKVIYIDEDEIGYVSARCIKLIQQVVENDEGELELVGSRDGYDSDIEILNNTDVRVTITVGQTSYKFAPHQKRTITVSPGTYTVKASSPGLIPYVGRDRVDGGYVYSWSFFIRTTYRRS